VSTVRHLVRELAFALRTQVLPSVGSHAARAHDAQAIGGDVTFAIDAGAERFLEEWLATNAPGVAFYSEDRGLVEPAGAETVLVVDPIDGTRPALAGLESCCVSVAAAPLHGERAVPASAGSPLSEPTMGDVSAACVVEIPSGAVYVAERGKGLTESPPVLLSANERLDRMFWTYGFRGRPARALTEVLAELIDASSVGGGSFDLGSAAFDSMCVVTGKLDAYVEPGPRMVSDVPGMREEFERVGGGAVLNNTPYDLAASVLILEEAGATVTDAYGRPLGPNPLLGSDAGFQMSIVASANAALHDSILGEIDAGIARLLG
jgi:myo-inositol-1(or 4)-monophosphatase